MGKIEFDKDYKHGEWLAPSADRQAIVTLDLRYTPLDDTECADIWYMFCEREDMVEMVRGIEQEILRRMRIQYGNQPTTDPLVHQP